MTDADVSTSSRTVSRQSPVGGVDRDEDEGWARRSAAVPTVPFDGTDHHGWTTKMKAVLYFKDLMDAIEYPLERTDAARAREGEYEQYSSSGASSALPLRRRVRDAKEAYVLIITALKGETLMALVRDVPLGDAYQLWARIANYYGRATPANTQALLHE